MSECLQVSLVIGRQLRESREECDDHAGDGSVRAAECVSTAAEKEETEGEMVGDVGAVSDGLVVHAIGVAEATEAVNLACTSHDHVESDGNEVETVSDCSASNPHVKVDSC